MLIADFMGIPILNIAIFIQVEEKNRIECKNRIE